MSFLLKEKRKEKNIYGVPHFRFFEKENDHKQILMIIKKFELFFKELLDSWYILGEFYFYVIIYKLH